MKLHFAVLGGVSLLLAVTAAASTAVLAEPVKFPVTMDGRRVGESTVQAGTKVNVVEQADGRVRIRFGSAEPVWVPVDSVRDLRVEKAVSATPEKAAPAPENKTEPEESAAETPESEPVSEDREQPALEEEQVVGHESGPDPGASKPVAPVDFMIETKEGRVKVERYGAGDTGIIFFSNSGDMAADIRKAMEFYEPLCEKGCSLFLWRYPESGPFAKVQEAISAFRRDDKEQNVDFSGVASAVLEGIRKETGLRKFLLAGNSLGGGVILWDHASLAKDENLKFMLVAPTQVFMPDIDKIGPMDNTALIAHRRGDDFVKDRKILSWIAANQSPLTKEAESRDGHIIVGQDLGHEQFASAIASFLNLPSR